MTLDLIHARLSDEEIRHIYSKLFYAREQPKFLQAFAESILTAEKREDFMILRPIGVLLIAKYSLGCYLASFVEERSA